jgi:hypothetical protein
MSTLSMSVLDGAAAAATSVVSAKYTAFGGADPLVRSRRPRRPLLEKARIGLDDQEKPARGPAADQGVRPTKGNSYLHSYFSF